MSIFNFRGEYYTGKMYVERMKKNDMGVVHYCNLAESSFYNIDPTSVPISWYRGNSHANMMNFSEALTDFKIAYKAHPYNPHVLNDLGSAYFMNNNIDSAVFFYKKSAQINPRFDEPKLNLTAIYINEGNYKKAKKWNESIYHDSDRRNYYRNIISGNFDK